MSAHTYAARCSHCGAAYRSSVRPRPGLTGDCGAAECLRAVTDAHNAAVAVYVAPPSQRRAPRQRYVYGDLGQLAAFSGMVRKGR